MTACCPVLSRAAEAAGPFQATPGGRQSLFAPSRCIYLGRQCPKAVTQLGVGCRPASMATQQARMFTRDVRMLIGKLLLRRRPS
jgi:hypothetical protein